MMRRHLKIAWGLIAVALLCLWLADSGGADQKLHGAVKIRFENGETQKLLDLLTSGDLQKIPQHFYGDMYDDELPDVIVFVDQRDRDATGMLPDTAVRVSLVKNKKERGELFGERYIYVLVFVAKSIKDSCSCPDSGKKPVVVLSQLDQRPGSGEFALISAVKAIAAAFSSVSVEGKEPPESKAVCSVELNLKEIGKTDSILLCHGRAKLRLFENTINRIRVEELDTTFEPQATFGHYSGSWVTSSIGVLGFRLGSETAKEENANRALVEPFLFAHIYLKRPQRPKPRLNEPCDEFKRQISYSLVAGTSLSNDLLDDLFFGLSAGHLLSTMSVVVGVNYRTETNPDGDGKRREPYFALGITFIL